MSEPRPTPKRVVLRYEDSWDELRAQLHADRTAGLAPSAVRDALAGWFDDGLFEVGSLVRRATSSYRGGEAPDGSGAGGADGSSGAEASGGAPQEVPADGLVAGWGRRAGRLVFVVAEDPALGSDVRGAAAAAKASRMRAHALDQSAPLLQIFGSRRIEAGAFIGAEFVRFGYGVDLDFERTSATRILKIAVVTGPLVDQAAIEATACHLVLLAGPDAGLHGWDATEACRLGLADRRFDDLPAALAVAGAAVEQLPPNAFDGPLAGPDRPLVALDVSRPSVATGQAEGLLDEGLLDEGLLDEGWCFELAPDRCPELRTVLGHIAGRSVGLADCSPKVALDGAAAHKLHRLVRYCDGFRLPLVLAHHGLRPAPDGERAEVDAVLSCLGALASVTTPVLEVVRDGADLRATAGVRATWSAALAPIVGVDATVNGAELRAELAAVLAALRPSRLRPDQDPRIATLAPRTLQ